MEQKRKHLLKKFLLLGIAILLASCSDDLYDANDSRSNRSIHLNEKKIEELLRDDKFVKSMKSLKSKTVKMNSRTIMEDFYGFTIDSSATIKEIISGSTTTYTMKVVKDTLQTNTLNNLVVQVDSLNATRAWIFTYNLLEQIVPTIHDSYKINYSSVAIKDINYNANTTAKFNTECIETVALMCNNDGSGGFGTAHAAGPICCWQGTHLFTVFTTTCTGGESELGEVVTSPHGGGGGGSDLNTPLTPCAKVKKAFTKLPTLRTELSGMSGKTGETTEWGRFKTTNASVIQTPGSTASGEVSFPIPSNGQYTMMAHTHNSPANTTYSVFSCADLEALATLVRNEKVDTDNFVAFLATADGTYYAFTIEDPEAFAQFFATALDTGFDPAIGQKRADQMNKYFDPGKKFNPIIKENNTDNLADQKAFLDFMQDNNIGASLFESNSTFTTFDKVTHNKTTSNVDKQPCN